MGQSSGKSGRNRGRLDSGVAEGEFSITHTLSMDAKRDKILLLSLDRQDESALLVGSDFQSACAGTERDGYMINSKWRTLHLGNKQWEVEQHARILKEEHSFMLNVEMEHAAGLMMAFRSDSHLRLLLPLLEKHRIGKPLVLIQLYGGYSACQAMEAAQLASDAWILCARQGLDGITMPRDLALMIARMVWISWRDVAKWAPREADAETVRMLAEKHGGVALRCEVPGVEFSEDGVWFEQPNWKTQNKHLECLARQYFA